MTMLYPTLSNSRLVWDPIYPRPPTMAMNLSFGTDKLNELFSNISDDGEVNGVDGPEELELEEVSDPSNGLCLNGAAMELCEPEYCGDLCIPRIIECDEEGDRV